MEHSRLCSCHFEESCFEVRMKLSESLGLEKRSATLKADAVPTLFTRLVPKRVAGSV